MNWIDIKDKQPVEYQEIIAAKVEGDLVSIRCGNAHYDGHIWECGNGENDMPITLWMPIEDLIATLPK